MKAAPERRERRRQMLERGIGDPEARAALVVYDRFLADMEAALADRPWLAGDRFSLAEIGVIPYVNRLDMLRLSGMWTESRPLLTDWFERAKARPSFQPSLFAFVPPPLLALMKDRGAQAWPQVREILNA